ncbi:hypothetical protein HORM4_240090 [Vibrio harveyi]|nr:hypothetical protein HORM4_240090 [Vibrio harveyi]
MLGVYDCYQYSSRIEILIGSVPTQISDRSLFYYTYPNELKRDKVNLARVYA